MRRVSDVRHILGRAENRRREDTRFARRASRESDRLNGLSTRGSPLGIGQPRAEFLDTFGVVIMRATREARIS